MFRVGLKALRCALKATAVDIKLKFHVYKIFEFKRMDLL